MKFLVIALPAFLLGLGLYYLITFLQRRQGIHKAGQEAKNILSRAERAAEKRLADAEVEVAEKIISAEQAQQKQWAEKQRVLRQTESELLARENRLHNEMAQFEKRRKELEKREQKLQQREAIVDKEKKEVEGSLKQQRLKLEEIAGLTTLEAKAELMRQLEYDARKEATRIIKKIEVNARERAKNLARIITTQAIEKMAPFYPRAATVSLVNLPNEEMKGRIIGREGRNIRSFERVTGVDVIVDDTPETILLACHNPQRRELAKLTLEMLVEDGRIHPARIEEFYQKCKEQFDASINEYGKETLFQLGILDMHEHLVYLVGRLRFRLMFGQNLLEHSVETAKIAISMAQAVDANVEVVKRAGILHEIGQIEEHVDDTHPMVLSSQIAKRFGESPAVVACIAHLHPDSPSSMPEAHILEAAEGLALMAPGVEKQGLERYVEHMESLETMVRGFKGVKEAYAIKAGRELLVLVDTESVDDDYTVWLAKDIAERIDREVKFAGRIKVQVVREARHVGYAT